MFLSLKRIHMWRFVFLTLGLHERWFPYSWYRKDCLCLSWLGNFPQQIEYNHLQRSEPGYGWGRHADLMPLLFLPQSNLCDSHLTKLNWYTSPRQLSLPRTWQTNGYFTLCPTPQIKMAAVSLYIMNQHLSKNGTFSYVMYPTFSNLDPDLPQLNS